MGVAVVEKAGYEADDLLGTIAKRCEAQGIAVSVVSGDRDLLQLASDRIKIRIPKTSSKIRNRMFKNPYTAFVCSPSEFDKSGIPKNALFRMLCPSINTSFLLMNV